MGDIKLAHSVFALPFALLGAFAARQTDAPWARFITQLALVVLCMVCARTWAMLVNRLADRDIDRDNPRTARRAFAAGTLRARDGWCLALASGALFMLACAGFFLAFDNPWPAILGLPVLAWIALYSFPKRFTWLCHVFLGGALAVSPIAAAIAIDPASIGMPALFGAERTTGANAAMVFPLAGMVLLWVAGFDVIYALQDLAFDRERGLSSVPARFGANGAIWISRALHAAAFALLVAAALTDPRLELVFAIGVAAVGVLLIAEHAVLAKRGEAGLDMAFFTLNGIVSCVLGAAGILDLTLL